VAAIRLLFSRQGPKSPTTNIGSGFLGRYADRLWLFTCQHNLEEASHDLTGNIEFPDMLVATPAMGQFNLRGRNVVRCSIAGKVVDCAAIEMKPEELQLDPLPVTDFRPSDLSPLESFPVPIMVGSNEESVLQGVVETFSISGYGENEPAGEVLAPSFAFIGSGDPTQITMSPGAKQGFSGGPVWRHRSHLKQIAGIYIQQGNGELTMVRPGGQPVTAGFRVGIAVRLEVLLRAIDDPAPSKNPKPIQWP